MGENWKAFLEYLKSPGLTIENVRIVKGDCVDKMLSIEERKLRLKEIEAEKKKLLEQSREV